MLKATFGHQGFGEGSPTSSVVSDLKNEDSLESADDYDKTMEFGPEISFSILFLPNILLHKPIKPQKFKTKIKASLNSGQLHFPRQKAYESFNMVCVVSIITYK